MARIGTSLRSLFLSAALVGSMCGTACAVRGQAYVRYYDGDHHQWHRWDDHEDQQYREYLQQRHMEYRQFNNLNDQDRNQYWEWRHDHP